MSTANPGPATGDWVVSLALHASLAGAALWFGISPIPVVQPLEVALRWAAPEPVPPAPQQPATQQPATQQPATQQPAPQQSAPQQLAPRQLAPRQPAPRQPKPARAASPQPHPTARPLPRPAPAPTPVAHAPAPEPAPPHAHPAALVPSVTSVTAPQNATTPVAAVAPVAAAVPATAAATAPVTAAATVAMQPAVPRPSPLDDQAYDQWRARLEQALQQGKRYPSGARRMGQTGTVVVHLRIAADGSLQHCTLHHSSGFKVLDHAAEQLVRTVAQALASQSSPGRPAELRIPIVYELTES